MGTLARHLSQRTPSKGVRASCPGHHKRYKIADYLHVTNRLDVDGVVLRPVRQQRGTVLTARTSLWLAPALRSGQCLPVRAEPVLRGQWCAWSAMALVVAFRAAPPAIPCHPSLVRQLASVHRTKRLGHRRAGLVQRPRRRTRLVHQPRPGHRSLLRRKPLHRTHRILVRRKQRHTEPVEPIRLVLSSVISTDVAEIIRPQRRPIRSSKQPTHRHPSYGPYCSQISAKPASGPRVSQNRH
jgi:hypothetical protein